MKIYPKIFETLSVDPDVQSALGTDPVRLYLFGRAPLDANHVYAVWQVVSGTPERSLSCPVSQDQWSIQVDVYGKQAKPVREAAGALVDAIDALPRAYVERFNGETRDPAEGSYRYSFDVVWIQARGS